MMFFVTQKLHGGGARAICSHKPHCTSLPSGRKPLGASASRNETYTIQDRWCSEKEKQNLQMAGNGAQVALPAKKSSEVHAHTNIAACNLGIVQPRLLLPPP